MTFIIKRNSRESVCFINTIAVGRRFARGLLLTLKAFANDGLLDICSIKKPNNVLPGAINIIYNPDGDHFFKL